MIGTRRSLLQPTSRQAFLLSSYNSRCVRYLIYIDNTYPSNNSPAPSRWAYDKRRVRGEEVTNMDEICITYINNK